MIVAKDEKNVQREDAHFFNTFFGTVSVFQSFCVSKKAKICGFLLFVCVSIARCRKGLHCVLDSPV